MAKGIIILLISGVLFGVIYYYPVLMKPLTTEEFVCWRVLFSFPAMMLLVSIERKWQAVRLLIQRIYHHPILLLGILLTTTILGIQIFLFAWSPVNGRALSTSLGYLILPLLLSVTGRVLYKDKLSKLQIVAILLVAIGVTAEIVITRAFSWDTAVVFVGYLIYFVLRKELKLDGIEVFFFEMALIAFVWGIYFFMYYQKPFAIFAAYPKFYVLIPLLGLITACAFSFYFMAIRHLPFSLFGLLSYFEPLFMVFISVVVLGAQITEQYLVTYSLLFFAMLCLITDGILFAIRYFKQKRNVEARVYDKINE